MRFFPAILLILAAPGGLAAGKPNIVLIVSDDQGYNDLGVLGDHIITPNLDRLAKEGVRLTNFYVVSVHFRGRMDGFQASLLKTGAELGSNRRGIMEVRRSGRRWLFEAWKVLLGKSIDQFRANA